MGNAQIGRVEYEAMPGIATNMESIAVNLNKEISAAYTSVQNLHNDWYGIRYNALVGEFNKLVPTVNSMLQLVVVDIPFALRTVAYNYSSSDTGSGTKPTQGNYTKTTNLPTPKDVGMRFMADKVQTVKSNVSGNFSKSEEYMDNIETEFNKVVWESEAATQFKAKFAKLKGEVRQQFEEIEKAFSALAQQALDDINAAESANTVVQE